MPRSPETSWFLRRPAPASTSFRITSTADGSSRSWFNSWTRLRHNILRIRANDLARRSDTDRWLFGVTLVLCLLGAVMIYSASAVTAQQQYAHSYYFLSAPVQVWLCSDAVSRDESSTNGASVAARLPQRRCKSSPRQQATAPSVTPKQPAVGIRTSRQVHLPYRECLCRSRVPTVEPSS